MNPSPRTAPLLQLRIQVPGQAARALAPEHPVLTVGRSEENEIIINDMSLSRFHARFQLEDGVATVEDLGSRNGTLVNGEPLVGKRKVGDGDSILVGSVPLLLVEPGRSKVLIDHTGPDVMGSAAFISSASKLWGAEEAPGPGADDWHKALGLIQDMSAALIRETAPDALLEDLLDKLFVFLDADRGVVLLRQGQGAPAPLVVRTREGRASKGTIRLSHTLVEAALDRGEALLLKDTSDPALASQSLIISGVTTAIVTPLEAEGQIIGLLYFDAFFQRKPFVEDELRVTATLAHLAASKIHNARLLEEVQRKRALEQEMGIAAAIQQRILPSRIIGNQPFRLHAELLPAKEVGGDLYDFFVKDGRLRFCIGDVSGKGVPAALVMALTKTLFRALADFLEDPAEVMAAVNNRLCEDTDARIFVTAFCGSLDLATGRLAYCNGGHDRPLLLQPGRANRMLEAVPGLALGILPTYPYRTQEAVLERGEALLLYTDGVTEAMNEAHDLFTLDRLMDAVAGQEGLEPADLSGIILKAVHAFVRTAPQADDITLLALRFGGGAR